jgi:phosphoserine phosphatase RsbU/P
MSAKVGSILIVNADDTLRGELAQYAYAAGHQVSQVCTGQQGLDVLASQPYQLVALPTELPDMTVAEFMSRMPLHQDAARVRTLVVAETVDSAAVDQLLTAGADDFLPTPLVEKVVEQRFSGLLAQIAIDQPVVSTRDEEQRLKIEHDIQIARQIQASFMPDTLPSPEGWELAARFQPAREVAGDWYDAFNISNNRRLAFVIADVVDKGVPAALFMALVRSMTRAFAQQNYSLNWTDALEKGSAGLAAGRGRSVPSTGTTALKNAVQLTNNYVFDNHSEENMFATLFFGMLDPVTGQLAYINAGHNPPLIYDVTGKVKTKLKATGTAVGMFGGIDYRIDFAQVDPGEVVFTYTDGVTEARNEAGDFFTETRLIELLSAPQLSAESMVETVYSALQDFMKGAVQFDDITMLGIYRRPLA